MLDLKYNETMLSKVEKGRVAHSSPSDGKQSGGVSCAKMMKQDIHMKIGEVIMVQTIKISSKEMKLINDFLQVMKFIRNMDIKEMKQLHILQNFQME